MQGLLVALSLAITVMLVMWLAKADKALSAASYGLLIGGALGNALDRLLHGAVADFVHFIRVRGVGTSSMWRILLSLQVWPCCFMMRYWASIP